MVEGTSHMFVTGPEVIKAVTAEEVSFEDLGGAMTHNTKSGVAHFAAQDDADCIRHIKRLLSFLPGHNLEDPPRRTATDPVERRDPELATIVPDAADKPYDMKDVVRRVVDDGDFFEVHEHFAQNLIVGFARLNGRPVGIVGNQPRVLAGVLDIDSSVKGARFVRFCGAFSSSSPSRTCPDSSRRGRVGRHHPHGASCSMLLRGPPCPSSPWWCARPTAAPRRVAKHIRGDYNVAWRAQRWP
jgi:propionyl-CoA carboxylase beta chain